MKRFIGDRIRMCRLKRLRRRQCYEKAKQNVSKYIKQLYLGEQTVRALARREERAATENVERERKRVEIRDKEKVKKGEFGKLRTFISDMIMMCRIKRVRRYQHYYGAKANIEWYLNMFRKRRQDDEKRNETKRKSRERKTRERFCVEYGILLLQT